jgi:hypothetical protein
MLCSRQEEEKGSEPTGLELAGDGGETERALRGGMFQRGLDSRV